MHYLNVPYTDNTKLTIPTLSYYMEKKEWTKEELVDQLRPMCKAMLLTLPDAQVCFLTVVLCRERQTKDAGHILLCFSLYTFTCTHQDDQLCVTIIIAHPLLNACKRFMCTATFL